MNHFKSGVPLRHINHRALSIPALLLMMLLTLALGACAEDVKVKKSVQTEQTIFYVDAVNGDDANAGTSTAPLKTITQAFTLVPAGGTVYVAPGTYDTTNGETFPIDVPAGVELIGDEPNKGAGGTPTLITGGGGYVTPAGTITVATATGDGATIAGFTIRGPGQYGVALLDPAGTVRNNTITGSFAGMVIKRDGAGGHAITGNAITGNANYGMWIQPNQAAPVLAEDNIITGQPTGLYMEAPVVDFGGGAASSAGGNAIYCNTTNDLNGTLLAVTDTVDLANNYWDHADLSGNDINNPNGATLVTTGNLVVSALGLTACP